MGLWCCVEYSHNCSFTFQESEEHPLIVDPHDDEDGTLHEQFLVSVADVKVPKRGKKGRPGGTLRKAPTAPKRFKSSYICFFMAKQSEIKNELGDQATVSNISKRSAEMWKTLSAEERGHWDEVAARDKERYMMEKAMYTGPWQIPWKRAKKDPSAPKRPSSAFLYFSQGRRSQIKEANPDLRNTQVSRVLGEMWRSLSDDERRPHLEKEKEEREKYKVAMTEWKQENEAKQEAQQKVLAETERHLQMHRQSMNMQEAQAQLMADPFGPQSGLVPNPYMPMPPMGYNPRTFYISKVMPHQ